MKRIISLIVALATLASLLSLVSCNNNDYATEISEIKSDLEDANKKVEKLSSNHATEIYGIKSDLRDALQEIENLKNSSSQNSPEYERVFLDLGNYSEYISLNITFTDNTIIPCEKGTTYDLYNLYCTGNISTASKIADAQFSNVKIEFTISPSNVFWSVAQSRGIYAELDYLGNSVCSVSCKHNRVSLENIEFLTSEIITINVINVWGSVLVPKD